MQLVLNYNIYRGSYISHGWIYCGSSIMLNWNFEMLGFLEGGKPSKQAENQQIEPGSHWWYGSILATVPSLLPKLLQIYGGGGILKWWWWENPTFTLNAYCPGKGFHSVAWWYDGPPSQLLNMSSCNTSLHQRSKHGMTTPVTTAKEIGFTSFRFS